MKKRIGIAIIIFSVLIALAGCNGNTPKVDPLVPGDYPDPPAEEILDAQCVYVSWDGANSESIGYELSATGIIEEGGGPTAPASEDEEAIESTEASKGIDIWFHGVSPGEVVVTFTTKNEEGKVVGIQQTAFRVYDDLTIANLHTEGESYR